MASNNNAIIAMIAISKLIATLVSIILVTIYHFLYKNELWSDAIDGCGALMGGGSEMLNGGWSKGGMLCAWARKKSPAGKLPFTIISLKKNYGGRMQRDAGNVGPSIGIAIGKYTGGKLRYWAGDSEKGKRSAHVQRVRKEPSIALSIKNGVAFDGNCAHEVAKLRGSDTASSEVLQWGSTLSQVMSAFHHYKGSDTRDTDELPEQMWNRIGDAIEGRVYLFGRSGLLYVSECLDKSQYVIAINKSQR